MTREARLDILREAEIVMGQPGLREIRQCPRLKWIQMGWAGTDIYTSRDGFPREILLTNARGCFQVVIAEYVMAVVLSLCRRLKIYAGQQNEGLWNPLGEETLLYGKRALILGAGDIGTGVAKRLNAFGVHVTGMRRTDRNYPDCYDAMITTDALDRELPLADIVIGCLPETPETKGLLDIRRLCMMGPDAFLINVGRGSLIRTDELVEVLEAGHLGRRGAGRDRPGAAACGSPSVEDGQGHPDAPYRRTEFRLFQRYREPGSTDLLPESGAVSERQRTAE